MNRYARKALTFRLGLLLGLNCEASCWFLVVNQRGARGLGIWLVKIFLTITVHTTYRAFAKANGDPRWEVKRCHLVLKD